MIEKRVDSKGNTKLTVRKLHNPKTGQHSGFRQDFSSAGWNQVTMDYLESIKKLPSTRLADIFSEAKALASKGVDKSLRQAGNSGCLDLQSDEGSEFYVLAMCD
jgi:hypothetical protein